MANEAIASKVSTVLTAQKGSDAAVNKILKPYGIEELARTGVIAMPRGVQTAKAKTSTGPKKRARSLNAPATAALPPS